MIAKIGKEAAEETVNAAMFQIGLGKAISFFISVCQTHHVRVRRRELMDD